MRMRPGRLMMRHVMWVWICAMIMMAVSGCGSSGSPSDPDLDLDELQFTFQLVNQTTGEPTDAISRDNPGVLKIWVSYANQRNTPPAAGILVTVTTTKGSFSVSGDGTDMTDADGLAEITLAAVNEEGEDVTGAGEITVESGGYVSGAFAFQIGVPDDTRLGAFIDGIFQEGVLALNLAAGETLAFGGTTLITADLVDGDGQPFDEPVTVSFISQCGATLTASVTAVDGRAVCVYTSNGCTADQDVVTAKVLKGGTDLSAMTAVPLAEEAAGFIEFVSVSPANIAVAGTATPEKPEISEVTFRVKDTTGNIMPRETILFSLTTTEGGITVSPLNRETDENGEVIALVKSGDIPAQVRVKAVVQDTTVSTLSGIISIEETPISESIGSITLSAGSVVVPADGQSRVTLRALVLDLDGDPLPAVAVDFTTTLGILSAATAWTRSDGVAEVQLQSSASGTALVTANAHGYIDQLSINVTPDGPMNLELVPAVVDDGTIEAGESRVYQAILRDGQGNPIEGEQINFSFVDDGNVSGAELSVSTAITTASGIATVTYTAGPDTGVDEFQAVVDSNTAVFSTVRVEVVEKQVSVGSLQISANPDTIPADGVSSSAITVSALDITDLPVPRGTEIVFTTDLGIFSNGGDTITVETEDDTGSLTVSLISAITPGTATVTAASGGVSQGTPVTFTSTEAPTVGRIELSADPEVIDANGSSSATITAIITDTVGDPIPLGQAVTLTTTSGSFANGERTIVLNTADDSGTLQTGLISSIVPGFAYVTAEAGGITQSVVVTFASTEAPDVGRVQLSADPEAIPADGISSSLLTATITDTTGTAVPAGQPVLFTTTRGSFANGAQQIQINSADDSGVVQTSIISTSTPGFAVVTAVSGGISQAVVVTFTDMAAPDVGSVSLSADPLEIPADGISSSTLTAVITDTAGDPVPAGQLILFRTNLGTFPNGLDEIELTTPDDTGRVITSLNAFTAPGFAQVTAISGGVSQGVVVTFTDTEAPDVGNVTLSADPTAIPADGASSTALSAAATDVVGNPMPQGTLFYFTTDLGEFADPNDLDNNPRTLTLATIDDSGSLNVALIADTTPGFAHVKVTVGGVSQAALVTFTDTNAPDVGRLTLSADPDAIPADGNSSTTVTATATDVGDNPMPQGTLFLFEIADTDPGFFVQNGVLSKTLELPTLDDTGILQVALISEELLDTTTTTVVVTVGGVTQQVAVEFTGAPAAPVMGSIVLTVADASLPADGVSSTTLTATLKDIANEPVPQGTEVVFEIMNERGSFADDGDGDPYVYTVQTPDDTGVVTVTLIASEADNPGVCNISAESGGITQGISVIFEGTVVRDPAFISLSTSKTSILTDGVDTAVITARVLDVNRVPVEGATVSFTTSGSIDEETGEPIGNGGQISASSVETDENGDASIELTSGNDKINDLVTITAETGDLDPVTIPVQMTGSSVDLDIETTSLNIDETVVLTVTVTDGGGLPVFGAEVKILNPPDNLGLNPLPDEDTGVIGTTGVNGTLTIDVTGLLATGDEGVRLTVSALGDESFLDLTVSGEPFEIIHFGENDPDPVDPDTLIPPDPENFSNTNDRIYIQVRSPQGNDVRLSTTIGSWVDIYTPPDPNDASTLTLDPSTLDPITPISAGSTKTIVVSPAVGPPLGNTVTALLDMGNTAGKSTVRVEEYVNPGTNDSLSIAISAPSDEATKVTLQVAPSVIAPSTGSITNSATLQATVLNNADQVVADAPVIFTLFRTTGGGEYINLPIVYTNELGRAETSFSSGALVSDARGVFCMARIDGSVVAGPDNNFRFEGNTITRGDGGDFTDDGFSETDDDPNSDDPNSFIAVTGSDFNDGEYIIDTISASVPAGDDDTLEVDKALINEFPPGADLVIRTRENTDVVSVVISGEASSIAIGGATVVEEYGPATYRYPMSVVVADSNGNPVQGATVNLSVWPTWYYTGVTVQDVGPVRTYGYPNEDENRNQILDPGEDTDGHSAGADLTASNNSLDPAKSTAGTVPATVVTDENGVGQFDYIFQKNYSGWLDVEISATALVYGSETSSSIEFALGYAESEKDNIPSSPWGPGPDGEDDPTIAASMTVEASPVSINNSTATEPNESEITVSVVDTDGSPMPEDTPISLVVTYGKGDGVFDPSPDPAPDNYLLDAAGTVMVDFSFTPDETDPGKFAEITATLEGNSPLSGLLSESTIVSIDAPEVVGSITLTASPGTLPYDGVSSTAVTVTIRKINGDPVAANMPVLFKIEEGSPSTTTFGGDTYKEVLTPDADGQVTVSVIAPVSSESGDGDIVVSVQAGEVSQLITIVEDTL